MHRDEPFRGLASVVDAWRALRFETRNIIADEAPPLYHILMQADAYMKTVERQSTVDEEQRRG